MKNSIIAISLSVMLSGLVANAVPADPRPKKFVQPDGTTITVGIRGDERCHFYVSEDDYMLVRNDDAFYFAEIDDDGIIKASSVLAMPVDKRSADAKAFLSKVDKKMMLSVINDRSKVALKAQSTSSGTNNYLFDNAFPSKGKQKVLVVLAEFTDKKFTVDDPYDFYYRMFNQPGFSDYGATGSVYDYFYQSSNGQFEPQFDVYGPITLAHNVAYYGSNAWNGDDVKPYEMPIEICKALDDDVDFSQYDCDGDGYIDNVFVYYAGLGEASGGGANTIWPHSAKISDYIFNKYYFDDVRLDKYGCTNEWIEDRPDGLGTFVHEFSHVMGLPDLYATTYTSSFTPGTWSVLDYGPYNNDARTPPYYSIFERYSLGWIEPTVLDGTANVTLEHVAQNQGCIIKTSKSNEFFLLENRQQVGWDEFIPGHGMLVWHIDFNREVWNRNVVNNLASHQYVDILEADNIKSDATRAGDAFPGTNNVTSITGETQPALCMWSGTPVGLSITDITEADGLISFRVSDNSGIIDAFDDASVTVSGREIKVVTDNPVTVCVFDMMGRMVDSDSAVAGGCATVRVSSPGVYVLKYGERASTLIIK